MTCDVASGRYVGKEAPNLLIEQKLKNNSEGRIHVKLEYSCLKAAIYFIVYISPYSCFMHLRAEIYMAVFDAPLWQKRSFLESLR